MKWKWREELRSEMLLRQEALTSFGSHWGINSIIAQKDKSDAARKVSLGDGTAVFPSQHYIIFRLCQRLLEFIFSTFGKLCCGLLSGRPASSSSRLQRRPPPPLAARRWKGMQKKKLNPIQTSTENPLERKKPAVWNLVAHLQQVAPLVHLLDVFVGEDAAGSLQLALSLSRSSGDDGLVQTAHRQGARTTTMIR